MMMKISLLLNPCDMPYKFETCRKNRRRPQGRPYTNTLDARFYLYSSVDDTVCQLKKRQTILVGESFDGKYEQPKELHQSAKPAVCSRLWFEGNQLSSDVQKALCDHFGVSAFTFLKVVRDLHLKILKIETVGPTEKLDEGKCSAQWVKKNIAHPRYKSKMKLHLVKGTHLFVFYNDRRLMENETYTNRTPGKKVLTYIEGSGHGGRADSAIC